MKNPLVNVNPNSFDSPLWCPSLTTRGRRHHNASKIFTFPADVERDKELMDFHSFILWQKPSSYGYFFMILMAIERNFLYQIDAWIKTKVAVFSLCCCCCCLHYTNSATLSCVFHLPTYFSYSLASNGGEEMKYSEGLSVQNVPPLVGNVAGPLLQDFTALDFDRSWSRQAASPVTGLHFSSQ